MLWYIMIFINQSQLLGFSLLCVYNLVPRWILLRV